MRSVVVLLLSLAAVFGAAVVQLVHGQGMRPPPPSVTTPPFPLTDSDAIAEGAKRFSATCTGYCHGPEGRVSRAPKLRGKMYDPNYLYGRIANGFPPMPAFQTILPPEEIWKLVAYIMSLSNAGDQ